MNDIPRERRTRSIVILLVLAVVWLFAYSPSAKLRSVLAAMGYTFVEYSFTYFNNGIAYTSFAQFWGNLLYTPLLLDTYWVLLIGDVAPSPSIMSTSVLMYIALFPFNIWLLEIIEDLIFLVVYGRNVAWCYCEYPDSYLGGSVRLGHAVFWLALGLFLSLGYPSLKITTDDMYPL